VQTHARNVIHEPLEGVVPGHEIRLAVEFDHGSAVAADEDSNQTLGGGSICDFGGL